jgi:hypothetical protein
MAGSANIDAASLKIVAACAPFALISRAVPRFGKIPYLNVGKKKDLSRALAKHVNAFMHVP